MDVVCPNSFGDVDLYVAAEGKEVHGMLDVPDGGSRKANRESAADLEFGLEGLSTWARKTWPLLRMHSPYNQYKLSGYNLLLISVSLDDLFGTITARSLFHKAVSLGRKAAETCFDSLDAPVKSSSFGLASFERSPTSTSTKCLNSCTYCLANDFLIRNGVGQFCAPTMR